MFPHNYYPEIKIINKQNATVYIIHISKKGQDFISTYIIYFDRYEEAVLIRLKSSFLFTSKQNNTFFFCQEELCYNL